MTRAIFVEDIFFYPIHGLKVLHLELMRVFNFSENH